MKHLILAATIAVASSLLADGKVIRIYNPMGGAPKKAAEAMVSQLKNGLAFPSEIIEGAPKGCPFADGKAGFAIILEDNAGNPLKMICAPDDGIVRVNVAALKTDSPDDNKLLRRCLKMMWRGFCLSLGSGYTRNPMCLLKPTDGSLASIDALDSCCPSPEAFTGIMFGASKRGIAPTADRESGK